MNNLDFIDFYERFYDFYFMAVKYNFYSDEIEKMRISMDEMYTSYFKKGG